MVRLPLTLASPAGRKARLSVLIYHRVLAAPDPLCPDEPDVQRFEAQMSWVRDWFNVLPLRTAVQRLFAGDLPARALAITFDDGYADNEALAAPILQRLGLNATFFVSTGFLDGGLMWNDRVIEALRHCAADELDLSGLGLACYPLRDVGQRRAAIGAVLNAVKHLDQARREALVQALAQRAAASAAPELMMRSEQVRNLRRMGMDVGAHTMTHPILCKLDVAAARDEMAGGRDALQALLGEPVTLFAYPNGVPGQDYAIEHVRMARECGFEAAVSTAWGAASARSDRFQIPRFTPWDRSRWRFGARLLGNLRGSEQRLA
jgi:peptidoglycan/xylan/chitin deacetylase (PgdA/CDA1 family)